MNKKKWWLHTHWYFILNITIVIVILFSVNKTTSRYKTTTHVSTLNAMPIVDIETTNPLKEIEFVDYGWATHNFDIINGKIGNDGIFYVNEIDMEYYIDIVKDSGELDLNLKALYIKNDVDDSLSEPVPYVEGKGYGPFDLPYKKDDAIVFNPILGYYESKYVSRVHYMLVYTYGTCEKGDQNCVIDANNAFKYYNFHIEVKTYQKG